MPYTVLAVDDDPIQLELIGAACAAIEQTQIEFLQAERVIDGIALCDQRPVDLVLVDHFLSDGSGMLIVDHMRALNPETPVIVITAHESVQNAVEFLRRGADDYLVKPLNGRDIRHVVLRSFEHSREIREGISLQTAAATLPGVDSLAPSGEQGGGGEPDGSGTSAAARPRSTALLNSLSEAMRSVLSVLGRAANGTANVLIEGESGTGKEVLARAMHEAGPRRDGPFVVVNCAALPETLIEAELFGVKRGAFTGATADRNGRFLEARGGTLMIDEVGEIPLSVQVKLLRALQFKRVDPVGSDASVPFDARIVAATNRSLKDMVERGDFREDLYYRLRVIAVRVPPLRERKADIPLLLDAFLQRFARENGRVIESISQEARTCLMRYHYPGIVRELENIIERSVVLSRDSVLRTADLPPELGCAGDHSLGDDFGTDDAERTLDHRLQAYERELIEAMLRETDGNQSEAARRLGIGERRLRSRLERLGLRSSTWRSRSPAGARHTGRTCHPPRGPWGFGSAAAPSRGWDRRSYRGAHPGTGRFELEKMV
jgi:DNA-binding NtrC family response regulator